MSVNKSVTLYTALNNDLESYMEKLEESFGKITECHDTTSNDWVYNDPITKREFYQLIEKGNTVTKFRFDTEKASFYLDIHQQQGKPYIAEMDDWGSDRYSYNEMFSQYFEFAKTVGNTYLEGFSENFDDPNRISNAYDKYGNSITYYGHDKENQNYQNTIKFAQETLGLDFMRYGARLPEIYIESILKDEKQNEPVIQVEPKEKDDEYRTYKIGHKENNEYVSDIKMAISKYTKLKDDFEEQLTTAVKNEDIAENLKAYGKVSKDLNKEYSKDNYDFNKAYDLKEKRKDLHQKVFQSLQNIFEQNIIWVKKDLEIRNNKLVEVKENTQEVKKTLKQKKKPKTKQKSLGNDNEL